MNKPRTIEGRWWIHGDDKPAHFGTLSYDPDTGLHLTVKVPQSRTSDDAWIEAMTNFSKPVGVPGVVHGTDEHNKPVTLFGCGCSERAVASGLDSYRIRSLAGILNLQSSSWEDAKFAAASVRYTLLSQWTNRHPTPEAQPEGHLLCFKVRAHDLLDTELSPAARLKIEETVLPQGSMSGFRIEMTHRAWFLFSAPTSATTVLDNYAHVLLRLLCLLSGERTFIEEVSFHNRDPFALSKGEDHQISELLTGNAGVTGAKRDVHGSRMIAPLDEIGPGANSIFQRWFECHERLKPVVDLYFAVLSNRDVSIQSRFLFLAQALEVYHARSAKFSSTDLPVDVHKARVKAILQSAPSDHQPWLREKLSYSNQKTLAQRLADILALHINETTRLTAGIADFAAKVRHSRNYYTHYGQELRQSGKVPGERELIRITYALEALLQACLLKELGIQGKPVDRIIERNTSAKFFDLEHGGKTATGVETATPPSAA